MSVRLSVVIPTHNRPAKLKQLLVSIFDQVKTDGLEKDIELFIVDDASREACRLEVQKMLREEGMPFVRYYFHEKQGGPSRTRNRGIAEASGDIIVLLDDDQILSESYFKNVLSEHEKYPDALIIVGDMIKGKEDIYTQFWYHYYKQVLPVNEHGLSKVTLITPPNCTFKKKLLETVSPFFDPDLVSQEDFDLSLRLKRLGIDVFKSGKFVTLNDCRSTLIDFIRQRFWYARGYHAVMKKHHRHEVQEEMNARMQLVKDRSEIMFLDIVAGICSHLAMNWYRLTGFFESKEKS